MSVETLKIIAMVAMLCDHVGFCELLGVQSIYLRYIGRISFPIFAYLLASNFSKTKNRVKYIKSLGIFAIVSEIPFDLMQGSVIDFSHQNVYWTLFIASVILFFMNKFILVNKNFFAFISLIAGLLLADFINSDYSSLGIFLIVVIFLSEESIGLNKLKNEIRESEGEYVVEPIWSQNLTYQEKSIAVVCSVFLALLTFCRFTHSFQISFIFLSFPIQMLGLLAIIPIAIYIMSGQVKILEGERDKMFKKICYWFYPLHLLFLWTISA